MTPYKTDNGKWTVLADYYDDSGKRHRKRFTAEKKKDLDLLVSAWRLNDQGHNSGITIGAAVDAYIRSREAVLSPSTIAGYKCMAGYGFSSVKNSRIDKADYQQIVNDWSRQYSPKTVKNLYALLRAAVSAQDKRIDTDARLPQSIKPQLRIPTEEELGRILQAVKGTPLEVPVMLGATAGMRRSEICALSQDDIGDGVINVHQAVVLNSDRKLVTKTTKTIAGTRTVYVPQAITDRIKEIGLPDLTPNELSSRYRRLLDRLEIPHHRFHDLRAFFASALHHLGAPDAYIQMVGGWSDPYTPRRNYERVMTDKVPEIAAAEVSYFGNLIKNGSQNGSQNSETA